MITMEAFDALDIRVGTVRKVTVNRKSRNAAYAITLDFGEPIGIKKTSSQITQLYTPEALVGQQLICCVNLPPLYIGLVKSEVRVLAVQTPQGTVLLQPAQPVPNGGKVS